MSENTNNEWEKREVGALWTQTEFGEDKKVPVVAFFNKDKKSENSPDFRIYLSKPAETQTETKTEQQTATSTTQGDDGEALL